jgi:hypothetical protein
MTFTDEQQDQLIRLLSPDVRIPPSVASPDGAAADDLRRHIVALAEPPAVARLPRRRLIFAVPIAAALAAAAVVATVMLPESTPVEIGGPAPARAGTLTFTEAGGYLDITIADPAADPQKYKAELAAHGLNIELSLAPAAPDEVGRVINQEESDTPGPRIKMIEKPGDCTANGSCSVGIRVPLAYKGQARVVFGRTPKPGEDIEGDAPVLTPQQQTQNRALVGMRVADARKALASRGQTASYRVGPESRDAPAGEVPGDWYVYDVAPLPHKVVALWVSADGKEPSRPKGIPGFSAGPAGEGG